MATNRDRKHFSRVLSSGSLEKVCGAFKLSTDTKNILPESLELTFSSIELQRIGLLKS